MVSARATGRAGQLKNDGSTIRTRVRTPSASSSTRWTMVPRHPSVIPTPERAVPTAGGGGGGGGSGGDAWSKSFIRVVIVVTEAVISSARIRNRDSTSPSVCLGEGWG